MLKPLLEYEIFQEISPRIVQAFEVFHRENPHVYQLYKRFCLELKAAGRTRYGIGAITERIRWHIEVETKSQDDFKICNNHRSCYARLLILEHPEYEPFFVRKVTNILHRIEIETAAKPTQTEMDFF